MSYSVGAHPLIITLYCFTLKWFNLFHVMKTDYLDENHGGAKSKVLESPAW